MQILLRIINAEIGTLNLPLQRIISYKLSILHE